MRGMSAHRDGVGAAGTEPIRLVLPDIEPVDGAVEVGDPEEGDPEEGDPEEGDPEDGDPEGTPAGVCGAAEDGAAVLGAVASGASVVIFLLAPILGFEDVRRRR